MISLILGIIKNKNKGSVTVLTQSGVGYEINVTTSFLAEVKIGEEVEIYTYLKVAETALELFGFRNLDEKSFFELLISVKGLGPRGALNILALGSLDEIQDAIGRGDVSYLTQVSGIGRKTAERLVVELKTKIGKSLKSKNDDGSQVGDKLSDVVEALVAMGHTKEDARDIVKNLDVGDKTVEELLKMALKRGNS
ncbi:MAG: Holliday junction branch migration protein RuvA [Candidatus Magasanikbacteria bacterium CG_4_10_14_0_2_um_filter_33_14]|uniref:Holliday junction branch migration complex subunit RuvA n=1 Tax=Candidatus Magasanikbacteria bacterium CG_4_10_14_0_2_um_filter_33_14 TaxID=1974636 RepID=A0A2M7VBJ5_9BACT|nr:MAG: Holliday junction branch migration protein RuvA [Candidatus Magasanikbacteria bacterium CG_4_10_14_0_2_um_filter_33_14]